MSIMLSIAVQAAVAASPDKKLHKFLHQFAKSIKQAQYNDAQLTGATVEGTNVVIHIVLAPNADAAAIKNQLTSNYSFESGFCSHDAVRQMSSNGFSIKMSYERGGSMLWHQNINADACQRYWSWLVYNNTDSIPKLTNNPAVPMFEFKGISAGKGYNLGIFYNCNRESKDVSRCVLPYSKVAGVSMSPAFTMYKTRLSRIDAKFDSRQYSTLKESLIAKYGEPNSERPSKWQNQMGAVFDNLETEWTFASGVLRLTLRGNKLDESTLIYADLYRLPDKKPLIDF